MSFEGAIFIAVVILAMLWPALRAAQRGQYFLAAAYAGVGVLVVFVAPTAVKDLWQAQHPDQEWSMAAPVWLALAVSPVVTVPCVLLGTLLINRMARPAI